MALSNVDALAAKNVGAHECVQNVSDNTPTLPMSLKLQSKIPNLGAACTQARATLRALRGAADDALALSSTTGGHHTAPEHTITHHHHHTSTTPPKHSRCHTTITPPGATPHSHHCITLSRTQPRQHSTTTTITVTADHTTTPPLHITTPPLHEAECWPPRYSLHLRSEHTVTDTIECVSDTHVYLTSFELATACEHAAVFAVAGGRWRKAVTRSAAVAPGCCPLRHRLQQASVLDPSAAARHVH